MYADPLCPAVNFNLSFFFFIIDILSKYLHHFFYDVFHDHALL